MGGVATEHRRSDLVNEIALLSASLAAPVLMIFFFVAAALDDKPLCVLSGSGAFVGLIAPGMGRDTLSLIASFAAWIALVAVLLFLFWS